MSGWIDGREALIRDGRYDRDHPPHNATNPVIRLIRASILHLFALPDRKGITVAGDANRPSGPQGPASSLQLVERIEAALVRDIRPGLRAQGGDVELVGVDEDRIVQVRLLGSCSGCSGAAIVLTADIEARLRAVVPEIRFIEPVP